MHDHAAGGHAHDRSSGANAEMLDGRWRCAVSCKGLDGMEECVATCERCAGGREKMAA